MWLLHGSKKRNVKVDVFRSSEWDMCHETNVARKWELNIGGEIEGIEDEWIT